MGTNSKWHLPVSPYPVAQKVHGSKKGSWVKPDIRHARSALLLPSVTSVIDIGADSLVRWQIDRAIFFCIAHPYRGGDPDPETHNYPKEDVDEYQSHIRDMAANELGEFAESGKAVHAGVERYFEGKGYPQDNEGAQNIIAILGDRFKELGVVRCVPEQIIGGPHVGIVGTPDMVGYDKDDRLVWIGDTKTVEDHAFKRFKTPNSLYPKWLMQLGAYDILLKGDGVVCDQVLSNRQTAECKLITHDHHERWKKAMRHHMLSWFYRNDYYPWKEYEKRKDELMDTWREIEEYSNQAHASRVSDSERGIA